MSKIRILLVRHGESEGNVDIKKYTEKGDCDIELTEKGWLQAFHAGQFLKQHFKETHTKTWPRIFVSSYMRPKQTLTGIVHGLGNCFEQQPKIFEDSRLVEKFFGATSALDHPHNDYHPDVIETLGKMSERTYRNDPFSARNLFGESTKDTLESVKGFIDGTLFRDIKDGQHDFLFVVHGAIMQAFVMAWSHAQMRDKQKLGTPGNGDIIEILGTEKNWTITKIYDGEKAKPVKENLLERIKPFTFHDLPPVPDFLKNWLSRLNPEASSKNYA